MTNEPTTIEKLQGLRWANASNAALSVFVQLTFFGSVFVLFLNQLGLSKGEIGFVLSLMPFTGLLALFIAPAVARFGYKRTYVTSFGLRNLIAAGLLLTPAVVAQAGTQAGILFVTAVVAVFAVLRSIGITASTPWQQEYVPNSVRGKFTATNNAISTFTGFLAVSVAGIVLAHATGLGGYMMLIGIGILFGFVSVTLSAFIPGGAPQREHPPESKPQRDLRTALRDSDFVRYLVGVGLFTVATVPVGSFMSLYMQEQIGLSSSDVVRLQNGVLIGSLLSSYLWGWAADRYGSKPVILYGAALRAAVTLGWLLLPHGAALSFPLAMGLSFMQGVADVGWAVGSARLLYNGVVPTEKKNDYLALYFAWIGLVGGFSQLIGGRMVEAFGDLSGQFLGLTLNAYTPLLLLALVFPVIAIGVFRRVRDDSTVGMGGFAGLFLRGNPFLAIEGVVRFSRASDEDTTVRVTERLGKSRSPLTVDELLEALDDPRFNVRFEAIISIARMAPDERLIDALAEVLAGPEPALSTVAAWALGRMGDPRAIEQLRDAAMTSKYRSVQAHAIRSLGVLGDHLIVPQLLARLENETDVGLQLAYASALGRLQVDEATGRMLELLRRAPSRSSRLEMVLDIARLVGHEHHFIHFVRAVRREPGTGLAQALGVLRRRGDKSQALRAESLELLDACAGSLAREDLDQGLVELSGLLDKWPTESLPSSHRLILQECAARIAEFGPRRKEYPILALHTLHVAWHP